MFRVNLTQALSIIALIIVGGWLAQQRIGYPQLPQVVPSSAYPFTSQYPSYTITAVASGSNLQTQITNAACGTKLNLAHNGTFSAGILNLPNLDVGSNTCACHTDQTKWRIIQGDQFEANYTPGVRTDPSVQYTQYPHISSNDANYTVYALAAANCWGFAGLDVTETTNGANAVFALGDATFSVANYPRYLAIWGSYIHGQPTSGLLRSVMANGNWISVVDSYLSDAHTVGVDSQGFAAWDGLGPWLIQNNSIEASTENLIFGGGSSQPGVTPSDITIQKNYIYKPLAWRPSDPTYMGIHYVAKDNVEFKVGQRILLTANVADTTWQDGQQELEIFNVGCSGTAPGNQLLDLTQDFNIFRHGPGGLVYGGCGQSAVQPGHRLYSHDNLWWDIDQCKWGTCAINLGYIQINAGPFGSPIPPFNLYDAWNVHETYSGDHMLMGLNFANGNSGNSYYGFQFVNSIIGNATSSNCWVGGQGEYSSRCGDLTYSDFTPFGKFNNDCFYGTSASGGSYLNATFSGLKQPATPALVFVNPGTDFHVAPMSICYQSASDGLSMGANIDAINAATVGVIQNLANPVTVTGISPSTFTHNGSTSITISGTNFVQESGLGVIIGGAGPTSSISTDSCGFSNPGQYTITAFTDTSHFTYTGGCVVVMASPVSVQLNDTINKIVNSGLTGGTINRYSPGNACTSVVVTNAMTITCNAPAATGTVTTGPVSVFVSQWGIPIQSTVFPSYN